MNYGGLFLPEFAQNSPRSHKNYFDPWYTLTKCYTIFDYYVLVINLMFLTLFLPTLSIKPNHYDIDQRQQRKDWGRNFMKGRKKKPCCPSWNLVLASHAMQCLITMFCKRCFFPFKGLALIFAGQENPFIIFRSKEIYIYFKTNNK